MRKFGYVIFLLPFFMASCENDIIINEPNCFEVRLIDQICGNAILQVVDANYTSVARTDWESGDGTVYQRVFSTVLPCNTDQAYYEIGVVFKITITSEPSQDTCGRCAAILPSMPELSNVIVIMDESCM